VLGESAEGRGGDFAVLSASGRSRVCAGGGLGWPAQGIVFPISVPSEEYDIRLAFPA